MKKIVYSIFMFFLSFFFFNIKTVNTIDDIALVYNEKEDAEKYYTISFYDFDIYDLDEAFKDLDIKILSIKPINCEKLYYVNTYKLIEEYNKSFSELGLLKSFKIESMVIISTKNELLELEKRVDII